MDKSIILIVAFGILGIFTVLTVPYVMGWNSVRTAQSGSSAVALPVRQAAPSGAVQDVFVKATRSGYDNPNISVHANQPVRFHFTADPGAGCGRSLLIPPYGVQLVSNGEEEVAQFTPTAGSVEFNCPMRMFRGTLVAS